MCPQSPYKDFPAFGVTDIRCMTAANAHRVQWLCYVLERLHSSYVLSTKIGLHRIDFINKTLVNDDFSIFKKFSIYLC